MKHRWNAKAAETSHTSKATPRPLNYFCIELFFQPETSSFLGFVSLYVRTSANPNC